VLDDLTQTLVNLRLEKAQECLRDAERTIADNAFFNAANRSYYSIFHAMRAMLVIDGFSSKTHSGVISEFNRRYLKTEIFPKKFSNIIEKAFRVRNNSDYDDFYLLSKEDVLQQTANAKVFLITIESYIKAMQSTDSKLP
jgi:uncharacterized protein (UPF0332 family)